MGGSADLAPDVGKPAAGSAGSERPGRVAWFFPGAAQVGGQRAGDEQLGVGVHDQANPPVGLLGSAALGVGEPPGAFHEPQRPLSPPPPHEPPPPPLPTPPNA